MDCAASVFYARVAMATRWSTGLASLLELLERVASDLGLRVEEPGGVRPPEGFDWVRDVVSETPVARVALRVFGSESGRLVLAMPVGFAQQHRALLAGLPVEERVAFISRLLYTLAMVCPVCRLGLGGEPVNPEGVVAEIHYVSAPDAQRLADDIIRLFNVYLLVNAMIWEKFPGAATPGQATSTMYT